MISGRSPDPARRLASLGLHDILAATGFHDSEVKEEQGSLGLMARGNVEDQNWNAKLDKR